MERKFRYEQIDEKIIFPERLVDSMVKYFDLGYHVELEPRIWKSVSGYYNTEYVLRVLKMFEVEELEE